MTSLFQSDPNQAPDSEYIAGDLRYIEVGNEGRMLDLRRTPIRVASLSHESGLMGVEVMAFEDTGAIWEIPYEDVRSYQFVRNARPASDNNLKQIADAVSRLDKRVEISCNHESRKASEESLSQEQYRAESWLKDHSLFLSSGAPLPEGEQEGSPLLFKDLSAYMSFRGLDDIEVYFSRRYVSNTNDEAVKGHRIAVAEMGLAPYEGKVLRGAAGPDLERRKDHIIARMGFLRALFHLLERDRVVLYRMESATGSLKPRRRSTALVSSSFRFDVVQEMSGWSNTDVTVAIYRQAVPVKRLVMTYLETAVMNDRFKEAEAVLIADPENLAF